MKAPDADAGQGQAAPERSSEKIAQPGDWRGETLGRMRQLIQEADPQVTETWKWGGTPVWEHDGVLCTGETYRNAVKLTSAQGASLDDPTGLFNARLKGKTRRATDIHEGEEVNGAAFRALIEQAVRFNGARKAKRT